MKYSVQDTITAPATASGRGGIGIVRISGPLVRSIAEKLLGFLPAPRYATFSRFLDENGFAMDEGIVLFFPSPYSFTGEDILELQGHGGPAVINGLVKRILGLGARLARPGEFSERASLNDKIDLIQAEAIADLIDAASEQSVRASLRSLQGEFSKKIEDLVEAVIQLRLYVEAAIDFAEEEIDFLADQQIEKKLITLIEQLDAILASAMQGSLLRDGINVVIIGLPNVGKSSLLNQLSGKDIAIVSDIPGTTRDLLREQITIDGMPIHIIDTAGLRESKDAIEKEGIRRAHIEMTHADLILCVVDARESILDFVLPNNINSSTPIIFIRNKIDLTDEISSVKQLEGKVVVALSAKNKQGIELLRETIKSQVGFQASSEGIFSARTRHLDALRRAKSFLLVGHQQLRDFRAGELLAEELRSAQSAFDEITGQFTTDDLLSRIFSSFCIGK